MKPAKRARMEDRRIDPKRTANAKRKTQDRRQARMFKAEIRGAS
jgi:hypothetical protein